MAYNSRGIFDPFFETTKRKQLTRDANLDLMRDNFVWGFNCSPVSVLHLVKKSF